MRAVMNAAQQKFHLRARSFSRADAIRFVERSIRVNSKTFYLATSLLPAARRRAVRSLYAFCRATDDLVDIHHASAEQVEDWRAAACRPQEQQTDPVLYAWAGVRRHYAVDPRYEDELVTGVQFDTAPRSYATWEELEKYCYHVASTVGLLSMPIVGLRKGTTFERAAPYAIKLGIALQLTNILRDVGGDARNGRVYLPESDLAMFGLTREDILARVQDERFDALMKFEIQRARKLYQEAMPGIAMLSRSGQIAVGTAALLYRAILDEIEAIHYLVHHMRAYTSQRKKLAMLPRILFSVINLRPEINPCGPSSRMEEC